MKYRVLLFICMLQVLLTYAVGTETRLLFTLNEQWKFSAGDSAVWAVADFDDSKWKSISSRQYWEEQGYDGYDGYGWYRQSFMISEDWKQTVVNAGGLYVKYEFADDVDEVFVNGVSVGRMGEFPPNYKVVYGGMRKYRIAPELLLFGEENVIAIRVYDNGGAGGLKTEDVILQSITPMDSLIMNIRCDDSDWVFENTEAIDFCVRPKEPLGTREEFDLVCIVTTDTYLPVDSFVYRVKGDFEQPISFFPPEPGFYRITLYGEQQGLKSDFLKFNVGYRPEQIVSPIDAEPDFDLFWEATLKELSGVVPDFRMTWLEERSQGAKNIYRIEMYSLGNVRIEGYYAVPKQKGKFPSVISFLGYGSGGGFPNPDNMPGFCEFILSTRGQGIQLPVNTYGKWVVHGLEDKLQYYYRGAFMDLVRGLDFLCSRPEVDIEKIFAEGGSQGGAFTLAACALDKRICAAAPYIPFLSDFRDYFKIAPWPRNVFEEYMRGHAESNWEEIYRLLSYFDIKNLAPRITCPIIMGVGLQDNICPPHINFSGYNQVKSPKHYYIYYDKEHTVGKSWWAIKDNFFRSFCN